MQRFHKFLNPRRADFWQQYYASPELLSLFAYINQLLAAKTEGYSLLSAYDLFGVREHNPGEPKAWEEIHVYYNGDTGVDGTYRYQYYVDPNWLDIEGLASSHIDPTMYLEKGADFTYSNGVIKSAIPIPYVIAGGSASTSATYYINGGNATEEHLYSTTGKPLIIDGGNATTTTSKLYVTKGYYSANRIANFLGTALGYTQTDSYKYRDNLEVLLRLFYEGPTIDNLIAAINITAGNIVAKYDGEKVLSTRDNVVITSKYRYDLGDVAPSVNVGDTLYAGQPLTNAVDIRTNEISPEWWKDCAPALFSHYVGKSLPTAAEVDSVMSTFLKYFIVYIRFNLSKISSPTWYDEIWKLVLEGAPIRTAFILSMYADVEDVLEPKLDDSSKIAVTGYSVWGTSTIDSPDWLYAPSVVTAKVYPDIDSMGFTRESPAYLADVSYTSNTPRYKSGLVVEPTIKNLVYNSRFYNNEYWQLSNADINYSRFNCISVQATSVNGGIYQNINLVNTHKYFYRIKVKGASTIKFSILGTALAACKGLSDYEIITGVYTATTSTTAAPAKVYDTASTGFKPFLIEAITIIDATEILGSSHTVDEYTQVLSQSILDQKRADIAYFYSSYLPKETFTIEFNVNYRILPNSTTTILDTRSTTSLENNAIIVRRLASGSWYLSVGYDYGHEEISVPIVPAVANTTIKISLVYSNKHIALWINGNKVAVTTFEADIKYSDIVHILSDYEGDNQPFALLTNFRVSNIARTDTELALVNPIVVDDTTIYYAALIDSLTAECSSKGMWSLTSHRWHILDADHKVNEFWSATDALLPYFEPMYDSWIFKERTEQEGTTLPVSMLYMSSYMNSYKYWDGYFFLDIDPNNSESDPNTKFDIITDRISDLKDGSTVQKDTPITSIVSHNTADSVLNTIYGDFTIAHAELASWTLDKNLALGSAGIVGTAGQTGIAYSGAIIVGAVPKKITITLSSTIRTDTSITSYYSTDNSTWTAFTSGDTLSNVINTLYLKISIASSSVYYATFMGADIKIRV